MTKNSARLRRIGATTTVGALVASALLFAPAATAAVSEKVSKADIAPDAATYTGWHQGAVNNSVPGKFDFNSDGLALIGRSQVIKGYADHSKTMNTKNLILTDLDDASIEVTRGAVDFQVPIYFDSATKTGASTTLQPANAAEVGTTDIDIDDKWISTADIDDNVKANEPYELSKIVDALEDYKTIAFGVHNAAGVDNAAAVSSVRSMTVDGTTYEFVADALTTATVKNSDIAPTADVYEGWHQGLAKAPARAQVTAAGLELAGPSQIIKGYADNSAELGTNNVDLAVKAQDADFTATGDGAALQVVVRFDDNGTTRLTTLSGPTTRDGDVDLDDAWRTSVDVGSVPADSKTSLREIIAALGSGYKVIAYGVAASGDAVVESLTWDGTTYTFTDAPPVDKNVTVLATDIEPDDSPYAGWHVGGDFTKYDPPNAVDGRGLMVMGGTQVIKGYSDNSSTLNVKNITLFDAVKGLSFAVEAGDAQIEIPMYVRDKSNGKTVRTTLSSARQAAGTHTASVVDQWSSSAAINGVQADTPTRLSTIIESFTDYKVIGFGVAANDNDVSVSSITWDGTAYSFDNIAPSAQDVSGSTRGGNSGKPVDITLLGADAESAVVYSAADPEHGTAVVSGSTLTYTPDTGFDGTDTFDYAVSDGRGKSATARVTVTVSANGTPVAPDVSASTRQNSPTDITLSPTDPDAADADLDITITQPSNGNAALDGDTVTYTPDAPFSGEDTFTYTATDEVGGSDTGTVTVTVDKNGAPQVDDVALQTRGSTDTAGDPVDTPLTATDPEGDDFAYSVEDPANGDVTLLDGVVTYTPDAGFAGTDTVTVTATDALGAVGTGTVTVTVVENFAPVPDAVVDTTRGSTTKAGDPVTVTLSATDANDDDFTFAASGLVMQNVGTVTVVGDQLTFTPAAGYSGQATVGYSASDDRGGIGTSTVTITVAANGAPVVQDVAAETRTSDAAPIDLTATDPDDDDMTTTITQPDHGTAELADDEESVLYTPEEDYSGPDSFTYTATDDRGAASTATVTVTVKPNAAPVAIDVTGTTQGSTTTAGTPVTVTLSASDAENDAITYAAGLLFAFDGTAKVVGNQLTFTPAAGVEGEVQFGYSATDSRGAVGEATVTITVAANDAPTVADLTATTRAGDPQEIPLLANDPQDDEVSYAGATEPDHGSIVFAGAKVTYTPDAGYAGSDSFAYTATDARGATSEPATVTVTVVANSEPTIDSLTAETRAGDDVDIAVSATDPEGDPFVISITQPAATQGSAALNSAGDTVTFSPAEGFVGLATFTYTATDARDASSASASITVNVKANQAPSVGNFAATTRGGTSVAGTPVSTALTASDPEDDSVSFTVTQPSHGTAVVDAKTVTYTPAAGFSGVDTFTFAATDARGAVSASGTVTVTVTPNTAPVAAPVTGTTRGSTTKAGTPVTVELSATDIDADKITYAPGLLLSNVGTATVAEGTNKLTFTPAADVSGTVTFGYVAEDSRGATGTSTVTITVAPNGTPVAAVVNGSTRGSNTAAGTPVTVTLSAVDPEGDQMTYAGPAGLATSVGTATVVGDQLTFTPAAGVFGPQPFGYTVTDSRGAVGSGTVSITVGTNGAPVVASINTSTRTNDAKTIPLTATDPDNDGVSITAATKPAHGVTKLNDARTAVLYTPDAGYAGADSFTYTATDSRGSVATATVNVTVVANAAPVVSPASGTTKAGTPVTVTLAATDAEGDAITYAPMALLTNIGSATVAGNRLTFTPASGYAGTAAFNYIATDDRGAASASTVTVGVAKLASSVDIYRVNPTSGKITTRKTVSVYAKVRIDGAAAPRGTVVAVYVKDKWVATTTVVNPGKVKVTLPGKLKNGKATLKVALRGTSTVTGSDDSLKVTVKKQK